MKNFARYSLLALLVLALSASSFAGVVVSVTVAPPVLPVYTQPACPGDGYIWTPGYWAWGPDGYYWVPGTWVVAPAPGLLWTPGYWGWGAGVYLWHPGYWGPHVGFYGGVNYGFGYFGDGFAGGYWHGNRYFYNRSVTNINVTNVHITNVYNRTVINNHVSRVSFNGGAGGIRVHARPEEERAFRERRFEATNPQMQHERAARDNRGSLASVNHGRPEIAATPRPGEFHGRSAVVARPQGSLRPENREADHRAMNHEVPRPNGGRNIDRPMPHQDASNHGGRPVNNAPRPDRMENHGGPAPRPDNRVQNHGPAPRPDNRVENHGGSVPHPDNRMENRGGPAPRPTAYHADNGGKHQPEQRGGQEHGHERGH